MPIIVKKQIRLHNPAKKAKACKKAPIAKAGSAKRSTQRKRSNPTHLMTLGMLNPQKKRTNTMTKKRSAPAKPASKSKSAPRKKNPFFASSSRSAAKKTPPRRKNPSRTRGQLLRPMDLAKSGATALVGLVATRQLPQMLLQGRNTGWMGYLANILTAGASAALASRLMGGEAGKLVFIGGAVYTVSRVLTEQLSPVGKYFSLTGLGDAQAAGLGQIRNGYFPVPVVTDNRGNAQIPQAIVEAVKAQLPAPAPQNARNMSGLSRFAR